MRASTKPRSSSLWVIVPAGLTASRHFFAQGGEQGAEVVARPGAWKVALQQCRKFAAEVAQYLRVVFCKGLQQQAEREFAGHGRIGYELKGIVQGGSFRCLILGLAIQSLAR